MKKKFKKGNFITLDIRNFNGFSFPVYTLNIHNEYPDEMRPLPRLAPQIQGTL